MKIFLDTSALFKKYVTEYGSEKIDALLNEANDIIVAPITKIELFSALDRRLQEKTLSHSQKRTVEQEINKDYPFFNVIIFNEALESKAIQFAQKYHLRAFDSLQLSSGCLSESDLFITSDKLLFEKAKLELKNVEFIG